MIRWKSARRIGGDAGLTPYAHWWQTRDRPLHSTSRGAPGEPPSPDTAGIRSFPLPGLFAPMSLTAAVQTPPPMGLSGTGPLFGLAVPDHAVNPGYRPEAWLPEKIKPLVGTDVPRDTVITGLIDEDISLGHARFRMTDTPGRPDTRILAAWMQGAAYSGGPQPFGREIFTRDIEELMAQHVSGAWLDEEAFNRAANPPPPGRTGRSDGARGLAGRIAHGTHVLDLACGADASAADPRELERTRIIAASLPPRRTIGMAGTFLEFYVVFAMRRIVHLADQLWRETYGGAGGFPIVLNLSYGQQAGTKTGTSLIETEFRNLAHARPPGAPLRLVMPIGNDNLTRSNARWSLKRRTVLTIPWRILPEDQSSNFVEVWVDLTEGEAPGAHDPFPLEITLTAPDGGASDPVTGRDGAFFDHPEGFLRVYADILEIPDLTGEAIARRKAAKESGEAPPPPLTRRMRYVIAMRPTLDHSRPDDTGRAGAWTLGLRWSAHAVFSRDQAKDGREVYVYVQVDQSPSASSHTSRRAYFDGERYQTHAPSGRVLDSFGYMPGESDLARKGAGLDMAPADRFWAVQRKGTHNALATDKDILLIAGHRASDGRHADFSATVHPPERIPEAVRSLLNNAPVASFPVDVSPSATGIRAAGAASGTSAVLRGTSCAAPQATRWAVAELRAALARGDKDLSGTATATELATAARALDEMQLNSGRFAAPPVGPKSGSGRMPLPAGTLR